MKRLMTLICACASLFLAVIDAEAARRLGGGGNLGMQRSAPAPQKAAPSAPAQQQQQQAVPATPAQQPQPSGMSKWLGPLAGLALGAGLATLFFNNGMGGLLAGLLVVGLIAFTLIFAARLLLRGRAGEQPLQYAGIPGTGPAPEILPGAAGANSVAATTGRWPADFNAAEFTRHARLNFARMQEAYDRNDLSAMRDFMTPDLYREIEADIHAEGDAPKKTEVTTLEANVIDVAEEAGSHVVSVRFSGLIREAHGQPEPFGETWHLVKPVRGRSGWLVAGIQQS
jgi:predicted lipid-binding transport protein (Tim44 family)